MLLKKKNVNTAIIGIILILMCHIFYLVNIPDGLWLLLYLILAGIVYLKYFKVKVKSARYSAIIILGIFMIIISSIRAKYNSGQPFLYGLDQQKIFAIILMSYFALQKLFYKSKINVELFEKIIIGMGVFECMVYILQHYAYPKIIFLNCMINIRNGARIYADSVVIELMIMICFSRILKNNKGNIKNIACVVLGIFYEFVVAQGRLECMALIFVLAVSFLIYRGWSGKKLIIGSIIVVIGIWIYNSGLIEAFMTTEYNTMEIRDVARNLYYARLLKNPLNLILGYGYLGAGYSDIVGFAGTQKMLYVVDSGIFGFVYSYGIIGIIFVLGIIVKSIKLSFKVYKNENEIYPLMFMIMNIILAYNIVFWWWKSEWTLVMVFLMCFLENAVYKNRCRMDVK